MQEKVEIIRQAESSRNEAALDEEAMVHNTINRILDFEPTQVERA